MSNTETIRDGQNEKVSETNPLIAFPNPAKSVTTINFLLTNTGLARLEILDSKGKVIKVLQSGRLLGGVHSFKLQTSSIPSGVYYYRLITDSFSKTKKLVIL